MAVRFAINQKPHKTNLAVATLASMLSIILVLLLQLIKSTESSDISLPGCPDRCGGVSIPYPFGIGDSCSMSESYNVTCVDPHNNGTSNPTPYLFDSDFLEILEVSIPFGQVRFNMPISSQCYNTTTQEESSPVFAILFPALYWLNNEKNKLVVTGCNTLAYLTIDNTTLYSVGCLATCDKIDSLNKYGANCSGIGCCQTEIPYASKSFTVQFDERYNHTPVYNFSPCSYAMVMEINSSFTFDTTYVTSYDMIDQKMPVVFDWTIAGDMTCKDAQTNRSSYACRSDNSTCLNYKNDVGYICKCSEGYAGNPYLDEGCQDIDECATQNPCSQQEECHNTPGHYYCTWSRCPLGKRRNSDDRCEVNLTIVIGGCAGIVALSFVGLAIYIVLERRKFSKAKEKYFQQHGGQFLLEKIKLIQCFGFTIFTMQQVKEATNNFDSTKIIGRGGQGTVYKATLNDQHTAIKKCKIIDESKKKEFGKEMLILSQINHKNIVKLLGCCLEAEVPMLIYEFIPNGTLFDHIHCKTQGSHFSLFNRLRIAHESAEALAYLHTSASPPIIHGDVKSANILLDQNYMPKVSDFGASMLAPIDEEQFVTLVQGTCGYLDPEYIQSCQLTEKSDVYSFGVVLLELLTSKPVIDFTSSEDHERSLSSRFLAAMEEKKIHVLLDDQIVSEDDMDSIMEVSELAKQCLSMKGDERPTMKEVADELDRIQKIKHHPWREEYHPKETDTLLGEASLRIEVVYTGSQSRE